MDCASCDVGASERPNKMKAVVKIWKVPMMLVTTSKKIVGESSGRVI
jgi:hypothetical protein